MKIQAGQNLGKPEAHLKASQFAAGSLNERAKFLANLSESSGYTDLVRAETGVTQAKRKSRRPDGTDKER